MQGSANDYWILSLDGGGVRCIVELVLLNRIFTRFPQLEQKIKLVAGTSAGAIVGASIAAKGFAETYRLMMTPTFMQRIFATSYSHDALTMNGWRSAMFSNASLAAILNEHFGSQDWMSSFRKSSKQPHLLIPSFCVDRMQSPSRRSLADGGGGEGGAAVGNPLHNEILDGPAEETVELPPDEWYPRIYHSFSNSDFAESDAPLCDVLLRTTAAPTYFPVYKGCVDGGVIANSPCLLALTTAKERKQLDRLENARILSIGTGIWPSNLNNYGENADLGKLQWISHISTLLIDSSSELATMVCRQLLGAQGFHRVQIRLPRYVDLYEYSAFADLKKWAEDFDLTPTFDWLSCYVEKGENGQGKEEKEKSQGKDKDEEEK